MEKSQLRKLAADYADGAIGEADYRREKARLIDAIANGEIAIERKAAPTAAAAQAENPAAAETEIPPSTLRTALPIAVGVIVLGGIAWLLYPSAPEKTVPPTADTEVAAAVPKAAPGLRSMVDHFLSANDWTEGALETFEQKWLAIKESERAEALNAPWFRRLATVLRQEINAQKALAELDDTGLALHKGRRLVEFGTLLGLGDDLPEFSPPEPHTDAAEEPPPATDQPPLPDTPKPAEADMGVSQASTPGPTPPAQTVAADLPPPLPAEPTLNSDAAWFAAQPDEHHTLQLFALKGLEQVDRLLIRFPDVDLRLVELAEGTPRYRILHGSFATSARAESAHGLLPRAVTEQGNAPFIKTFGALRETASEPPRSAQPELMAGAWAASQPDDHFTLQVFAVESDRIVRNLPSKYESLDLHIHESTGAPPRYRVLLGSYTNREDAESAKAGLPPALVEEAGPPFIKRFDEIR